MNKRLGSKIPKGVYEYPMLPKRQSRNKVFEDPSSLLSQPVGFFLVLHPQEECPMAGFCERKDNNIPIKPDGDRGYSDDVCIKDLKPRLDLDGFPAFFLDIVPALLERTAAEDHLVWQGFYAAHGATSSSIFLRGIGLCTAFAAIFTQGKSIDATIWS